MLFPRVRVFCLVTLGFYWTTIALPAWGMLIYWAFLQFVGGLARMGAEGGGVAFWAHSAALSPALSWPGSSSAPITSRRTNAATTGRNESDGSRSFSGGIMTSIRRQFLFLRAYTVVSLLAFVVLGAAAFRQVKPQNLGEVNVERINVVDADGTLRLVISNKDRMHPGVRIWTARPSTGRGPVAGMIFFNDEGDEVGGLTYTGQDRNGVRSATAGIMFE